MKLKEPLKIKQPEIKKRRPLVPAGFTLKCKKDYSRKEFKDPQKWEIEL